MRTIVALFDDLNAANSAVREMVEKGFPREEISLMANDPGGEYDRSFTPMEPESSAASEGASVGAGIGAVLGGVGGLLVGLGALTIPGIGLVIAAGPLAAALAGLAGAGVGAVAGGVTGGLIGALADMGIPEESAQYYVEGIRRGGTLVTVRAEDDMTNEAVDILNRYNPVDVNQLAAQWRESGWTGLESNVEPYRVEKADSAVAYSSSAAPVYREFVDYDSDFRNHFSTTTAGTGYTYDQYLPAYRYGYDLATDTRYHDFNWDRLEPEARMYWEERNPGTWEQFKTAVRHAWEEIKDPGY